MMSEWKEKRLGIIGAGNMAEALTRGILSSGLVAANRIWAVDPAPSRVDLFRSLGCNAGADVGAAAECDVVLLAVKPQMLAAALIKAVGHFRPGTLLVSIAAGVPASSIERMLPPEVHAIRVMPNTPLLVGRGMSVLTRGSGASDDDMRLALALFSAAGEAVEVGENLMDAVTAVSGSGPAYLFSFAEALTLAAEENGLPPDLSKKLVAATLRGAAEMLAGGGDPAAFRRQVTSPGGTTEAALSVLAMGRFPELIVEAVTAARRRGEELGKL